MIFDAIAVLFSALLLVYWFRYSCLLILRTQPQRDYARQVATANHLHVFEVQTRLTAAANGPAQSLQGLDQLLDRDYRLLMYLSRHAANFQTTGFELQQLMLVCDYRVMSAIYRITSRISSGRGVNQLAEMAAIITRFASVMGERADLAAA
ncbi:MAG: hypothetical protein M3Z32_06860 [Acidobacteriota bacterium]|nr:hypothetical protein [Acidobacteriota bacterium]